MSGRAAVDGRRPVDGRRGGWMDAAVCRSVDPEAMFPDERDFVGIARALAVCAVCPVQRDCLAYACRLRMESGGPLHGVWGWRLPEFFTFATARRQLAVMV